LFPNGPHRSIEFDERAPDERKSGTARKANTETNRIAFLLDRDGEQATINWVKRTLPIYRSAVLNPAHFASSVTYRRGFLSSCVQFRQWLVLVAMPMMPQGHADNSRAFAHDDK
jgi:hypothetical protein